MTSPTCFRKKPVEVEAIRWTGGNYDEIAGFTGRAGFVVLGEEDRANSDDPDCTASVFDKLHSTWVLVKDGQWIIRGVKGEFYPCDDEVFAGTYEPAAGKGADAADATGISPGRAAYEAYAAAMPHLRLVPWDEVTEELQPAMEAAAKAGHNAYPIDLTDLKDWVELQMERDQARDAYRRVCEERDQLRAQVGAVYTERARLVAFLAACYQAAREPDQDDDEYEIVYVTTPAGQMSWHIRTDDAAGLLAHVPQGGAPEWDGHSTEVKYERLADMTDRIARVGGIAGAIASVAAPDRTEPYPTAAERRELQVALSSLTDRAEASKAIIADEADEYRKLATP